MSKRWTEREDKFLAAYFDAMGDYIGVHDLGRPKGAATKRVEKLKECGAWSALQMMSAAHSAYNLALQNDVLMDEDEAVEALRALDHCIAFNMPQRAA